jgi:predicted DNA binding CopG/RHH family protein
MQVSCQQTSNIQSKIIRELEEAPAFVNTHWSEFDTEVVRKYYGKKDTRVIARLLKRSTDAIYNKAQRMGLYENMPGVRDQKQSSAQVLQKLRSSNPGRTR